MKDGPWKYQITPNLSNYTELHLQSAVSMSDSWPESSAISNSKF